MRIKYTKLFYLQNGDNTLTYHNLFDRWCNSCKVGQDFAKLRQVLLLEEFKNCLPDNVKAHLEEQQAKEIHQAAVMADDYVLTHKTNFSKGSNLPSKKKFRFNKPFQNSTSADNGKPKPITNNEGSSANDWTNHAPKGSVVCDFCKKPGHSKPKCYSYLKKMASDGNSKPVALANSQSVNSDGKFPVRKEFLPFVTEGFISVELDDKSSKYPVTILRDTGASQCALNF